MQGADAEQAEEAELAADGYHGVCPACASNDMSHALVPCSHLVCKACADEADVCPICQSAVIARSMVLAS